MIPVPSGVRVWIATGYTDMRRGTLIAALSATTMALLVAGGLLYSIGVVFHLWTRLPYQKAIWHTFVLVAAGCHYAAIFNGILPNPGP